MCLNTHAFHTDKSGFGAFDTRTQNTQLELHRIRNHHCFILPSILSFACEINPQKWMEPKRSVSMLSSWNTCCKFMLDVTRSAEIREYNTVLLFFCILLFPFGEFIRKISTGRFFSSQNFSFFSAWIHLIAAKCDSGKQFVSKKIDEMEYRSVFCCVRKRFIRSISCRLHYKEVSKGFI